jgi:hypothetical protein
MRRGIVLLEELPDQNPTSVCAGGQFDMYQVGIGQRWHRQQTRRYDQTTRKRSRHAYNAYLRLYVV